VSSPKLKRWQRIVLWPKLRFVLPTLTALVFNKVRLRRELKAPRLPEEPWARAHARQLLARSEERLRGIEAKGPGLAALSAIIGAAVLASLVDGWDDATTLGRLLLAVATWYAVFSLLVPIYLVGPQPRDTVDAPHLGVAASREDAEDYLAREELNAAQRNVRRTQRLANLQDAARNELAAALAVVLMWALLGPVTGLLVHDGRTSGTPPARAAHPSAIPRPAASPARRPTPASPTTSRQARPTTTRDGAPAATTDVAGKATAASARRPPAVRVCSASIRRHRGVAGKRRPSAHTCRRRSRQQRGA